MSLLHSLFQLLTNKTVPPGVELARKNICQSCPHIIKVTGQCGKCLCFIDAKTKVPTEYCPLFKWNVWVA